MKFKITEIHSKLVLLKDKIQQLTNTINMGYIPRMDGSITASSNLTCNCCAKRTPSLIILEHDYPIYPDLGLCVECIDEYVKLIHNHE